MYWYLGCLWNSEFSSLEIYHWKLTKTTIFHPFIEDLEVKRDFSAVPLYTSISPTRLSVE